MRPSVKRISNKILILSRAIDKNTKDNQLLKDSLYYLSLDTKEIQYIFPDNF